MMGDRRFYIRSTGPSATLIAVERCAAAGEVTVSANRDGRTEESLMIPNYVRTGVTPAEVTVVVLHLNPDSSNQPPAQPVTDSSTSVSRKSSSTGQYTRKTGPRMGQFDNRVRVS